MEKPTKYREKMPGVIERIGKFISSHAEDLASVVPDTKDFTLTIRLHPGDGDIIFEPTIEISSTHLVRSAFRFYYDLDGGD